MYPKNNEKLKFSSSTIYLTNFMRLVIPFGPSKTQKSDYDDDDDDDACRSEHQ